jgi:hypothetical protein
MGVGGEGFGELFVRAEATLTKDEKAPGLLSQNLLQPSDQAG